MGVQGRAGQVAQDSAIRKVTSEPQLAGGREGERGCLEGVPRPSNLREGGHVTVACQAVPHLPEGQVTPRPQMVQ